MLTHANSFYYTYHYSVLNLPFLANLRVPIANSWSLLLTLRSVMLTLACLACKIYIALGDMQTRQPAPHFDHLRTFLLLPVLLARLSKFGFAVKMTR